MLDRGGTHGRGPHHHLLQAPPGPSLPQPQRQRQTGASNGRELPRHVCASGASSPRLTQFPLVRPHGPQCSSHTPGLNGSVSLLPGPGPGAKERRVRRRGSPNGALYGKEVKEAEMEGFCRRNNPPSSRGGLEDWLARYKSSRIIDIPPYVLRMDARCRCEPQEWGCHARDYHLPKMRLNTLPPMMGAVETNPQLLLKYADVNNHAP